MSGESILPPRELWDKPALELCWRGLAASIAAGQITRKRAYEMIETWEENEEKDRRSDATELSELHSES